MTRYTSAPATSMRSRVAQIPVGYYSTQRIAWASPKDPQDSLDFQVDLNPWLMANTRAAVSVEIASVSPAWLVITNTTLALGVVTMRISGGVPGWYGVALKATLNYGEVLYRTVWLLVSPISSNDGQVPTVAVGPLGLSLRAPDQDPGDRRLQYLSASMLGVAGDSIRGVFLQVPPDLTVVVIRYQAGSVSFWVSDGLPGIDYPIGIIVSLASGGRRHVQIIIPVRNLAPSLPEDLGHAVLPVSVSMADPLANPALFGGVHIGLGGIPVVIGGLIPAGAVSAPSGSLTSDVASSNNILSSDVIL